MLYGKGPPTHLQLAGGGLEELRRGLPAGELDVHEARVHHHHAVVHAEALVDREEPRGIVHRLVAEVANTASRQVNGAWSCGGRLHRHLRSLPVLLRPALPSLRCLPRLLRPALPRHWSRRHGLPLRPTRRRIRRRVRRRPWGRRDRHSASDQTNWLRCDQNPFTRRRGTTRLSRRAGTWAAGSTTALSLGAACRSCGRNNLSRWWYPAVRRRRHAVVRRGRPPAVNLTRSEHGAVPRVPKWRTVTSS
mmetsp:Transcript_181225/g.575114  ORF Transcript_181225/g.575114 Transcript_181225/m.575114 type:complete len:248 (+) Transcript_181225:644-1387(+)